MQRVPSFSVQVIAVGKVALKTVAELGVLGPGKDAKVLRGGISSASAGVVSMLRRQWQQPNDMQWKYQRETGHVFECALRFLLETSSGQARPRQGRLKTFAISPLAASARYLHYLPTETYLPSRWVFGMLPGPAGPPAALGAGQFEGQAGERIFEIHGRLDWTEFGSERSYLFYLRYLGSERTTSTWTAKVRLTTEYLR